MPKNKNNKISDILLDRDGCTITPQQALSRLLKLKRLKRKLYFLYILGEVDLDFDIDLDIMLLEQFLQQYRQSLIEQHQQNGVNTKVDILTEAENQLLKCKIETVTPETYPCGVLIKALEG